MSTDIPLQPESEFTSDMVKAVENIAVNVKLGSSEFSSSIDALSKSIDGLKSSLSKSINSLKSSANNVAQTAPSSPRASQGKAPSSQDPAIAKKKDDEKRAKEEIKELRLKTQREKANFEAEKLLQRIKKFNETESARKKKKDSDTQNQVVLDVFENVGKGFGDVFAVTEEQVAAMRKSKKGKKEKPFEMDMGALASYSSQTAEKGSQPLKWEGATPLPPEVISSLNEASSAWSNLFSNISLDIQKQKTNESEISSLISEINDILGDASDQAKDMSLELQAALDPRTYLQQAVDALNSLNPPELEVPPLNEFEQLFNDLASMFDEVMPDFNPEVKKQEPSRQDSSESHEDYLDYMKGVRQNEPQNFVGPTQAGEAKYYRKIQLEEENKAIKSGMKVFDGLFKEMFGKMGSTVQNVIASTITGINESFSDKSPVFDFVKKMFGLGSVAGQHEGEQPGSDSDMVKMASGEMKKRGSATGTWIAEFVDKLGNQYEDYVHSPTEEGAQEKIRQGGYFITKISNVAAGSAPRKRRFPSPPEGNINSEPETDPDKDNKNTNYFAKGTPASSGSSSIFDGIGTVFSNWFGGKKKKKKKKKSLLNNDYNNWDTDSNYENKYKDYHADGGEIEENNSPFKPKGTDTVPAMLTPGEEVVKKSAAEKPENKAVIDAMNKSSGGKVGYFAGGTPAGGKGIVGGITSLALGPVGKAFTAVTGAVNAASEAISMFGGFIAKANPAIMEQVGLAMNDLQGVIGRALVPAVQVLLPVFRYVGDGMDGIMKSLMPAVMPLVEAFKTIMMPLIELQTILYQFLAPALSIASTLIEGFALVLDPIIQLVSEVIETFTTLLDSFLGGIPITKIIFDGFQILGQIIKIFVGLIVSVLGAFVTGMGFALQAIGEMISWVPLLGDVGKSIKKGGESLQKTGEAQRDRGVAKMGEGVENIVGKIKDPNYKMKDNTRYKPGDLSGKGIVKGSSVGAAVREAQTTSISGVGDEIRKQALMAATGSKTQEESLAEIAKGLSKPSLAEAVKDGVIAANAANKGVADIKGKDPFGGRNPKQKPLMAPV